MNKLHILSLLATAMIAAAPCETNAKSQVTTQGDTTTVVVGADTVRLVGGKAIENVIKSKLNDTIYDGESEEQQDDSEITAASNRYDSYDEYRIAKIDSENQLIKLTVFAVFTAFVLIVFIVALFAYLQRRAKYRMIEKAIDKNYKLPAEFTTIKQPVMRQPAYTNPWDTPTPTGMKPQSATQAGAPIYNWRAFKKSIIVIIVGLVLVLFFLSIHAFGMAFLCSGILLYGLAQAFFIYQDQRNTTPYHTVPPQVPSQPQQHPEDTSADTQTDIDERQQ